MQRVGCCFTAQLTLLRNSTMSKEHSNMHNRSAVGAESVDMRTRLYLLMYSSVSLALKVLPLHQDMHCWSLQETDLFAMMTLAPL